MVSSLASDTLLSSFFLASSCLSPASPHSHVSSLGGHKRRALQMERLAPALRAGGPPVPPLLMCLSPSSPFLILTMTVRPPLTMTVNPLPTIQLSMNSLDSPPNTIKIRWILSGEAKRPEATRSDPKRPEGGRQEADRGGRQTFRSWTELPFGRITTLEFWKRQERWQVLRRFGNDDSAK